MNEDNIYEILGIPIYCTYKQLMEAYASYRRETIKKQSDFDKTIRDMEEENSWLKNAREDSMRYGSLKFNDQSQKELFTQYNRTLFLSQECVNDRLRIDKLFKDNVLNVYSIGKSQKEIYDRSHKTPGAILGMGLKYNMQLITARDRAEELIQKYPSYADEIKWAADIITQKEQPLARENDEQRMESLKQDIDEMIRQHKENMQTQEEQEQEVQEQPHKEKIGFKGWVKRLFAPALAVIGISVTVPKLLPEGNNEKPIQNPNPIEETTGRSFRDSIRVQGVLYDENGMQFVPDEQTRKAWFEEFDKSNKVSVQNDAEANQDKLASFKARMQNDAGLLQVVEKSLSNIAVNGKYDATPYEKLDYIMSMLENKDINCVLSYTQKQSGIKEYILNCVNDTILYYVEKETGERDITLREEKEGVSIISGGGARYIATTYKDIAKTSNSHIGTQKTVTSFVARMLNGSKELKNRTMREYYTNIDSTVETMENLFTGLNSIGNGRIVVDRDEKGIEI